MAALDPYLMTVSERPHFCVGTELVMHEDEYFGHWFSLDWPSLGQPPSADFLPTRASARRSCRRNPVAAHLVALRGWGHVFAEHPYPLKMALLRDAGGLLPLHYAAFAGQITSCSILMGIMGGAVKALKMTSRAGYTALHSAARGGHLELVENLLRDGASDAAGRAALILMPATRHNYTALDCAIAADASDVVELLLHEPELSPQRTPEILWTELVLERALQLDSIAVVRLAIHKLGSFRDEDTALVATSLRTKICMGKVQCWPFGEVADELELGGRWEVLPSGPMMNVRNRTAYARLLSTRGDSRGDVVDTCAQNVVRARDKDGKTLLHFLMEAGYTTSTRNHETHKLQDVCVALFADLQAVDKRGLSVAHVAATRGQFFVTDRVYRNLNFLQPAATATLASPLQIMIALGHHMTTWKDILRQCRSVEETLDVLTNPFKYKSRVGTPMEWLSRWPGSGLVRELRKLLVAFGIPVDAGSNPGDEWLIPGCRTRQPRWIRRQVHPVAQSPVNSVGWGGTATDGPAVELVMDGASAHSYSSLRFPHRCPFEQLNEKSLPLIMQRDVSSTLHCTFL